MLAAVEGKINHGLVTMEKLAVVDARVVATVVYMMEFTAFLAL